MRWFDKRKPKDAWEDIQSPIADNFEGARKIREICNSAVVTGTEKDQYRRAAKVAMEVAMQISDDLMRDAAVCQIAVLCMEANEVKRATILSRAVLDISMREELLNKYPAMREAK